MFIYSLTLQKATAICNAVYGNFSAPKVQEIVVGRGKVLELLRPDEAGKMQVILSTEVFGVIRDISAFRLTGANRDHIVVGSDSGRITILNFNAEKNVFEKVHQETYGKSGCRRITPGQYLGVDPAGRALMVGACEKQKHVYVMNRDNAANLTISSPLEAHKSHTIVFDIVGVDCGYDNPIFAAIELDYADADQDSTGEAAAEAQKHLTFYELDLGLNHVVRKWTEAVDNGANMLVAVPGGGSGPGGVLVCAENFIIYKNQGHADVRAVIPRREDLPGERGVLLVAHAAFKQKNNFYLFVQSEYGDIYRVSLEHADDTVSEVKVKYFDTITPCTAMCIMKTGFLFAASEFGNHALYQIVSLGDDDDDVETSSATLMETEEGFQPVFFNPRGLKNLERLDDIESLSPITDMKVSNLLGEETPQIFSLCGRGPRSTLRMLRPGLAVSEMAVSELPGNPSAVWTVRKAVTDEYDSYIVVSFVNATLVLSIGETVEEVNDSGFLGTTPSLHVALLADNSMLQVHPSGLRHIRADRRINEWKTPGRKQVQQVACNSAQVVIALSGGEIIYFELDQMTGQLMEIEKKDMAGDVACLDIAPVPEGRQRSRFLAVGSFDSTVRVLSLDPEDCMQGLALQQVAAAPTSLLLTEMGLGTATSDEGGSVFLNIALSNGVLLRTEVDRVTGQLSDTRTRFLGARAPKLFNVEVRGRRAMLALSSRPWLAYVEQGRHTLTPLSYHPLEYASAFTSEQCPDGIVAVTGNTLRIVTLERLGEAFNQSSLRLRYTPRKFAIHPQHKTLMICEADHGVV
eukprot:CAMPEP_0182873278 /NCGR_PEP_ID=MMETSP0034_2-20130328/12223_1 /TAXON_ID=156128 /ORGANISM="Nephroselmis pyriformis, Strain CCMP717" /LENGTH=801 /DNA_ID=CAMNT_0025005915 /DNA_START=153 /DNA_END=2554 /DNA_ORIENTATION=-